MSIKIALIMMQKNESLLLEPWIRYHVDLIGTSSIFIYDNGSTDAQTLTTLAAAENMGLKINRTYNHQKDYYARGELFADLIKSLDASNPHDFYFPIDCDEFLACDIDGKLSCQRDDILVSLAPLVRDGKVLTIPHKYVNSPYHINRYSKITNCKKCFFAQGACEALSDGFHEGKSKNGSQERQTKITYIEFHYKPYADHMRLSAQKN
ncbi:MAG: glycosyltransferase family 2 protein [Cyanobium sp. ELA712]